MATEIIMPKVAMGQTEGRVTEWLIKEGRKVEKGQLLMLIETEKVVQECESIDSGLLLTIKELYDQVVPCGTVIGWLVESKEELAELKAKIAAGEMNEAAAPPAKEPATEAAPVPTAETAATPTPTPAQTPAPMPGPKVKPRRIKISPVAKVKAREFNLNLENITGTGPGGRIIKKNIDDALARDVTPIAQPAWSGETIDGLRVKASLPMQGMRKAVADHVTRSLATSAHLTVSTEVDMAALIALRQQFLEKEEELGIRITYNDIFVMCLAKAVKHVPLVNSSLVDNQIRIWEDINVAVAVALEMGPYESGLITPVIKSADQKSLVEIGQITRELVKKAKSGTLSIEDMSGGTITLSNIGAYAPGWTISTPILNQPQAFIVQPGAIVERVVAIGGEMVVRPIMSVSITFDHRIMDGVPPLKWLTKFKELIEKPTFLLL